MSAYVVVLAVAAAATFVICFPVRWFAVRIGAVVHPDERRVHTRPTPTIGGGAMFLAFLVAMVVASRLGALAPVFRQSSEPLGVVIGSAAIFVVGLVDDLRDMSAPAKVAGQVLAAMCLYFFAVTMYTFKVPFVSGLVLLSPSILPLVTAIWVIGMANAVNLIDGLDGLAAGIVAIGSGALALYALRLENLGLLPSGDIGPLVAVVTCGVCIGFLPHNFHPARIFMGDAGAMFLGLLMACSTMVVGGRMPETSGVAYFFWAPILIPVLILGVPIVDTAFAIVRRTVRRVSLTHPDRGHLHHQLMRLGHGQRRAVLILWAWTALMSGLVLYPTYYPHSGVGRLATFLGIALLAVVLYTLFRPGRRRRAAEAVPPEPVVEREPALAGSLAIAAAGDGIPAAAVPEGTVSVLAERPTPEPETAESDPEEAADASSCPVAPLDARMARPRPDRDGAARLPITGRG